MLPSMLDCKKLLMTALFIAVGHGAVGLPTVDLGYAVHKPVFNETGDYYRFSNIRYADPPLGRLRFKHPVPVSTVDREVNDGSVGFMCHNVLPRPAGVSIDENDAAERSDMPPVQPLSPSEDCLFLDVVVPRAVFEKRNSSQGAPVMAWIHGGGYIYGNKQQPNHNPSGLIARSQENGDDGIVFVTIGYRLGMFGFLNADDDSVNPNAGLMDQLRALEWVQENIALFGGNPDQVTATGYSAGGGAMMYHIAAEGGRRPTPFNQAIIQSAEWQPLSRPATDWARTLTEASKLSGRPIRSGAELAALDAELLVKVNENVVYGVAPGAVSYGPSVDGNYVEDKAIVLLREGRINHSLKVLVSHTRDEAVAYLPNPIDMPEEDVRAQLRFYLPKADEATIDHVLTDLYPPAGETDLYDTAFERLKLIVKERGLGGSSRYVALGYGNQTYNYRWQVGAAAHGQDPAWQFYNGDDADVTLPELAFSMQRYIANFVKSGDPNGKGLPAWPLYGDEANLRTFGEAGIGLETDDLKNERTDFWYNAEY